MNKVMGRVQFVGKFVRLTYVQKISQDMERVKAIYRNMARECKAQAMRRDMASHVQK